LGVVSNCPADPNLRGLNRRRRVGSDGELDTSMPFPAKVGELPADAARGGFLMRPLDKFNRGWHRAPQNTFSHRLPKDEHRCPIDTGSLKSGVLEITEFFEAGVNCSGEWGWQANNKSFPVLGLCEKGSSGLPLVDLRCTLYLFISFRPTPKNTQCQRTGLRPGLRGGF
jgi:hypothetical protein